MKAGTALIVAATAAAVGAGSLVNNHSQGATGSGCHYRADGALPDATCTPGAINHAVTQQTIKKTICKQGWTATIRPPASVTEPEKFASMRAYGDSTAVGEAAKYEYDHLIPLELGGAPNDTRNLWPERRAGTDGSYAKDKRENRLRVLVCLGTVKLAAARRLMRTDWRQPLP